MSRKPVYRVTSLFLVLAITFAVAAPARAQDGSLDPAFGNGGIVATDFGPGDDFARDVALQPDGKIIVAGAGTPNGSYDFALARYHSDGSLDTTFGAAGKVTTDYRTFDLVHAMALQPDGKIVVAGDSWFDTDDFAVARYHSDGSLDISFGTGGIVTTDFGDNEYANAVVLQPDGRIILAGTSYHGMLPDQTSQFALVRYNSDGSLDTTFDGDGIVITDFGSSLDGSNAVTLLADGKILVAGFGSNGVNLDFALARYNSDGSLDASFGTDGKVLTDFAGKSDTGTALVLQVNGKIIVAGYTSKAVHTDFALARYNSDGSLDASFGTDGRAGTDLASAYYAQEAEIQQDGKIVVAGFRNFQGLDIVLARFKPDGSLDTTFGTEGIVTSDFSSADLGHSLTLQPDGKILVVGSSNAAFAIARYDVTNAGSELVIDIKPNSQTNHLNPKSSGRIKVAILSTPDLDALTMVDRNTVRFGHTGTEASLLRCKKRGRDVNKDGLRDLVCVFSIPLTGFQKGDQVGILSARTVDGIALTGSDSVQVGPKVPRDEQERRSDWNERHRTASSTNYRLDITS
jgi:uncharacterized delta-60 repeat protein